MKQVIECKRACFYDVNLKKVIYILSDEFNAKLSNQDIECILYNPNTMVESYGSYWLKNTSLRLEIYSQYKEVETVWDKIIGRFK